MVPMVKPADEAQSEEEPSKSKVSSFWSSFLYMLIEKWAQLGHTSPYKLLLTAILPVMSVQLRWLIKIMYGKMAVSYRFYAVTI